MMTCMSIEDEGWVRREDCLDEMSRRLLGPLPLGRVLERCSLEEAAEALEVWLWGPASALPLPALRRWLDLQRADFLRSLVSSDSPVDRHQLAFLVRATASAIHRTGQLLQHTPAPCPVLTPVSHLSSPPTATIQH